MLPDKKTAILADYRTGKAKSATELAKLHGVSRSAVYRLLKNITQELQVPQGKPLAPQAPQVPQGKPQVPQAPQGKREGVHVIRREPTKDDSDVTFDSDDDAKFLQRSDKFAEDLELPASSNLQHTEDNEEENEEELDNAAVNIFGEVDEPVEIPSALLDKVFTDDRPRGSIQPPKQTLRNVSIPYEEVTRHVIPRIDRNDVIQRLIFNVENFLPLLTTIVGQQPESFIAECQKMDDDELTSTLRLIERTRSVGNIAAGFKQTFFMVAQATEVTSSFLGVKARGFTERLKAEEQQVAMIMKELAIENWERVKAMDSPTTRLGILFCMTLAQTDASNRLNDAVKPALSSRVSPGTEAAHSDL